MGDLLSKRGLFIQKPPQTPTVIGNNLLYQKNNVALWTPNLHKDSGAFGTIYAVAWQIQTGKVSYNFTSGTKSGDGTSIMEIQGCIKVGGVGTANFTQLKVTNLPATVSNFFEADTGVYALGLGQARIESGGTAFNYPIQCEPVPGTTQLYFYGINGMAKADLTHANLAADAKIYFACRYLVEQNPY